MTVKSGEIVAVIRPYWSFGAALTGVFAGVLSIALGFYVDDWQWWAVMGTAIACRATGVLLG